MAVKSLNSVAERDSFDHASNKRRPTSQSILQAARYPEASKPRPDVDTIAIVEDWLQALERSLLGRHDAQLPSLFFQESFWRDHFVLSQGLKTTRGHSQIAAFLQSINHQSLKAFRLSLDSSGASHAAPRVAAMDRKGLVWGIQAVLHVETIKGSGRGHIRLLQDARDGQWRCFTLFTTLEKLSGIEESIKHFRTFGAPRSNISDQSNGRPETNGNGHHSDLPVLIIGAGQAGLSLGARLKQLSLDFLVIDRHSHVGDNWRDRYDQLVLHDPVWYNHLPYMPFPETWPVFTPRDKVADWLQIYALALDLRVRMSTSVVSAKREGRHWKVTLSTETSDDAPKVTTMSVRHIVMATGQAGLPNIPDIPGIDTFTGKQICHSSAFRASQISPPGSRAVVIGGGTSAHDIAQRLALSNQDVTMVQRSTVCVDPTRYDNGKDMYTEDGPAVEDADLLTQSMPLALLKTQQTEVTARLRQENSEFYTGLEAAGLRLDWGTDGAGRKFKFLETGGGYYINVGASEMIIDGKIKVQSQLGIEEILPNGLRMSDDSVLPADIIVFATGYKGTRHMAARIFEPSVMEKLDDLWGIDDDGELKSNWRRTPQEGLWFASGNLSMSRYYSRLLALQIVAIERGE